VPWRQAVGGGAGGVLPSGRLDYLNCMLLSYWKSGLGASAPFLIGVFDYLVQGA
jgi:hypothetical protein